MPAVKIYLLSLHLQIVNIDPNYRKWLPKMRLVLASTSKYRKILLEKLGLTFISASPNVDERRLLHENARDRATRLSTAKALAVAPGFQNSLIVGSDQVAECAGEQIDKPGNYENCVKQLRFIRGKAVTFYTGISLYNTKTHNLQSACEVYEVQLRAYSELELQNYIRIDQPFDCAGSFKAESLGIALFAHLRGDDPNTLIGLPLIRLSRFLENEGTHILSPSI